MVVGDDPVYNRESQPRPLFFGGIVWIENIWHMFFGDTLACIFDDDFDRLVLGVIPCDDGDSSPLGHRLFRIHEKVEKNLFQGFLVAKNFGEISIETS